MSKSKRDRDPMPEIESRREPAPFPSPRLARAATLGGVAALVIVSSLTWQEVRQIRTGLDGRLTQIDGQLAKMASRLDQSAPAAARRGPDPNRVYTVKTEGAPAKGPAGAPVTIAEFSDFQ